MWIMNMYAPASQEENSINILQSQLENIEVEEQGNNNENTEEEEEVTKVEKAKFYNTKMAKIQQEIEKRASAQDVIIAGMDANAIMDNTTDMNWEGIEENRKERMKVAEQEGQPLRAWINRMGLVDMWRIHQKAGNTQVKGW